MKRTAAAVLLAAALAFGGCSDCYKSPRAVASINGECVAVSEVRVKTSLYGIELTSQKEAKDFLNLLINNRLIIEEARKDRVKLTGEEVKAEIGNFVPGYTIPQVKKFLKTAGINYGDWREDIEEKALIKKEIDFVMRKNIKISERELRDYFWTNLMKFRKPGSVKALQIMTDTPEKANEVLMMLSNGEDFEKMAQKYSSADDAKSGGDLGYFGEGDMPAFISRAVSKLKPGDVSGVVKSPYGYHIFKLEERQVEATPKFDDVKEEVLAAYYEEKKDGYFASWMKTVRKKADIKIKNEGIQKLLTEVSK